MLAVDRPRNLPAMGFLAAHLSARPSAVIGTPRADTDPKTMLKEIADNVTKMKADQTGTMKNFQKALDEVHAKIDTASLGGSPTGNAEPAPDPEYTSLFASWARSGRGEHDLKTANMQGDRARINAALTVTPGDQGGNLAPIEWDRQIRKAQLALSPMRQISTVVETSVRAYSTLWNTAGWGSGWVGETAIRPGTSTPTLLPLTFPNGELYAFPAITQQLIDDADFPIEKWLSNEVGEEFSRQEGITFISGDGVNKPSGLLTFATGGANAATHPGGSLTVVPSGSASALTPDGLMDFIFGLPAPYRQNSRWLMNSATFSAVNKFKDLGGNFLAYIGLEESRATKLLGYPITIDENMPNIAAGNIPIAFGDFKRGYVINDRIGVRVLRDPYMMKPYVGFYTTKRVGGGVLDPKAIRLMKIATS